MSTRGSCSASPSGAKSSATPGRPGQPSSQTPIAQTAEGRIPPPETRRSTTSTRASRTSLSAATSSTACTRCGCGPCSCSLLGVAGTWLLVGELTGRNRLLQLSAAAVVGLWPMATFIASSVNPDAAVNALWALALWLGVRLLRRGWSWPDGLGLTLVDGGLRLDQACRAWRCCRRWRSSSGSRCIRAARRDPRPRWVLPSAIAASVLLAAATAIGADRVVSPISEGGLAVGDFLNYMWQFYLPWVGFLSPLEGIPQLGVWDIWVKTGWGAFGWLEVRFPDSGLRACSRSCRSRGCSSGPGRSSGAGSGSARRSGPSSPSPPGSLLLGLHLAEWQAYDERGDLLLQGRYLFPLLPLAAVWLAAIVALVPAAEPAARRRDAARRRSSPSSSSPSRSSVGGSMRRPTPAAARGLRRRGSSA